MSNYFDILLHLYSWKVCNVDVFTDILLFVLTRIKTNAKTNKIIFLIIQVGLCKVWKVSSS